MTAEKIRRIALYSLMVAVVVFFLFPIVWTFLLSIRPTFTNRSIPPTVFFQPTIQHYVKALIDPGLFRGYLFNSLIISGTATAVATPFAISAAYALSRYDFRGRKAISLFYLGLFLGPPVVFLLPFYIQMSNIGWTGTYQSMIIIYQTFAIPFMVLVIKSFMDEVPISLEEAAQVDGTSRLGALWKITIPLSLPGIVVSAMFAFVFSWNNAVYPLVLSGQGTRPLPIGTLNLQATSGINWNAIGTSSVITMLPPMLIFLALGKYLVRGLTLGATKA
ncbi:MAG: carbohydrate ABC transporter permease [Candidatus Bipolaricaulota bacterium]